MLSTVLRSKRAVQANIEIIRVFVRLREMLVSHKELVHKFEKLERRITEHDEQIQTIFEIIKQLMVSTEKKRNKIGFEIKEGGIKYDIKYDR